MPDPLPQLFHDNKSIKQQQSIKNEEPNDPFLAYDYDICSQIDTSTTKKALVTQPTIRRVPFIRSKFKTFTKFPSRLIDLLEREQIPTQYAIVGKGDNQHCRVRVIEKEY